MRWFTTEMMIGPTGDRREERGHRWIGWNGIAVC
jgi:hypothetical protein